MVLARFLPGRARRALEVLACLIGVGFGVALLLARHSTEEWRTTALDPATATVAGIATAGAWLATISIGRDERWRTGALVGAGATGLALFSAAQWTVPALLFWVTTSLAMGILAFRARQPGSVWLGIVASDVCLAAALVTHVLDTDGWRLPSPAPDRAFWLVLAAVVIRAGVVPRYGIWRMLGTSAAPGLPLLVGGAMVLAAGLGGRTEPWAAAGLALVALAQALWGLFAKRLAVELFAGWPAALSLAFVFAAPESAAVAGATAALGVTVVVLWPLSSGRAQVERGFALSFAPLTAGFGALILSTTRAFGKATTNLQIAEAIPWVVVASLLPVTLVAGALLAARIGREGDARTWDPSAVLSTWAVVAASIGIGVYPGMLELPDDVLGSSRGALLLLLGALAAGGAAGTVVWMRLHEGGVRPLPGAPEPPLTIDHPARASLLGRALAGATVALAVATAGTVGWVTYEGLRQGFL